MAINNVRKYYEYWENQDWVIKDASGNPLPGSGKFMAEFKRFAQEAVEGDWNMDTSFPIPMKPLSDND